MDVRPGVILELWQMIRAGVLNLSVLDIRAVGLDDPSAALEAATQTAGLQLVVLVP